MSLAEQYHNEHKARLARMGAAPKSPPVCRDRYAPIRVRPNVVPHPHNFYWRNMWFWDLVNVKPPKSDGYRPPVERIIRIVARHYGISYDDIISARRTADIVLPRQVSMYLAKHLTLLSYPAIGRLIGKRDHTTVLHGCKKVRAYMAQHPTMGTVLDKLKQEIGAI